MRESHRVKLTHLQETGYTYFEHLSRAWWISFVLLVHGIFPNVWVNKASNLLCDHTQSDRL